MSSSDNPVDQLLQRSWPSFQDAFHDLSATCEAAGFAIRKQRSEWKDHTSGQYRRHTYVCAKGGAAAQSYTKKNPDEGQRHSSTKKTACEWSGKLVKSKDDQWKFDFINKDKTPRDQHNHPLDTKNAAMLAPNRRRWRSSTEIMADIEAGALNWKMSHSDILDQVKSKHPEVAFIPSDIKNILAKARRIKYGDRTATQQFLETLESDPTI